MNQAFKKLITGIIIVAALLLSKSVALARWIKHNEFMTFYEASDLCTANFSFGIADTSQRTYDIYFYKRDNSPTEPPDPLGQKIGVTIPAISPEPVGDCKKAKEDYPQVQYCGGTTVEWTEGTTPNPLDVGTELEMWVKISGSTDFIVTNFTGENDDEIPLIISNCANIQTALLQTESGSTATTVTTDLVFQLEAYDANVGNNDGNGIDNVVMSVLDPNGDLVHQRTEYSPGYCGFDGNDPCQQWVFANHNYEWPNGTLIKNGSHTLQAIVNANGGSSKTAAFPIDIQLPLVTNLIQTGPGTTTSVVTDSLVFQLETYVGPRYSDGQDITNVVMSVLDPNGELVHQRTEYSAGYCAFDGNDPCQQWVFANHNYEWPNGTSIKNGKHTLRATVNTEDGRSYLVEYSIVIRDPSVAPYGLIYLPLSIK